MEESALAIVRTTGYGAEEAALISALTPWFGERIVLAVDARSGRPVEGAPPCVMIDDDRLRALGLEPVPDWGWRCGDYFQLAAAEMWPDYEQYWLFEADVVFNMPDVGAFFGPCAESDADFLACQVGPQNESWSHYRSVAPFFSKVQGCLYPVTRMSRAAAAHVLAERRRYGAAWSAQPQRERAVFANDESFVCSSLASDGRFSLQKLEALVGDLVQPSSFGWLRLILRERLDKEPKGVLHPVISAVELGSRLPRKMLDHTVPFLGYFSDIVAQYGDERTNRWFAERAAHLLRRRHGGIEPLPGVRLPWSEPKGTPHALIRDRHRQFRWRPSAASDFTYHTLAHRKEINFRRVLPYAVDHHAKLLTLVDTDPRQVERDPFLFVSQYENATYAAFANPEDLPDRLDAREAQNATFVFSIGRCGSTLTSNLAKAIGLTAYSECDALIGLPAFEKPGAAPEVERMLRCTVGAMIEYAEGAPIVIKMKAMSNDDVRWFTTCFPKARIVFLSRELSRWSTSFVRVFGKTADEMLQMLRSGAHAHRHLDRSGRLSAFVRYEQLVADPASAAAMLFDVSPDADARKRIAAAAERESQSGLLPKQFADDAEATARLAQLRRRLEKLPPNGALATSPILYDRESA